DEFYDLYQNTFRLIKRDKIQGRDNLEAYLEGAHPSSTLGSLVKQLRRMRDEFRRRRIIDYAFVTGIVIIVATYAISTISLFDSTRKREAELEQHIYRASEAQIEPLTRLQVEMSTLSKQVQQLAADLQKMKSPTPSPQPTPKQ